MRQVFMVLIMISMTVLPQISSGAGNEKAVGGCIDRFSFDTYGSNRILRIWIKSKTGRLFPFFVLSGGLRFDSRSISPIQPDLTEVQHLLNNLQSAAELQRFVEIKWITSGSNKDFVDSVIVYWNKSC